MTELEAVPGVGPAAAKKLRAIFITSAEILSVQNPMELEAKTKLGEGTVAKIIKNARELSGKFGFKTGIELEEYQATVPRLKFGLKELDSNLLGGMEAGSITEVYGGARGGKSFICHHLAVRAQLAREQGGLEGRVLWLDTESSFKTNHIRANAVRWGLDPDVVLGNISVAPLVHSSQIEEYRIQIQTMLAEGEYKMLVVDSLTGLSRAEYSGKLNTLATKQYRINHNLNWMRRLGMATDAIFLYSNQVTTNIGFITNPSTPVGGNVVSHASDYRFFTRATKDKKRKITLRDNAGVPEFDYEYHIGWGGMYATTQEKKDTVEMILERLGPLDAEGEEKAMEEESEE